MSITSKDLIEMDTRKFAFLYNQSRLNLDLERVVLSVLEEQYLRKNRILVYKLENPLYGEALVEGLKTRLSVSSIYIAKDNLYVDWSLDEPVAFRT
jgi:hypothetical protein